MDWVKAAIWGRPWRRCSVEGTGGTFVTDRRIRDFHAIDLDGILHLRESLQPSHWSSVGCSND